MAGRQLRYRVPWGSVFGLWPEIAGQRRTNLDRFTRAIVAAMRPTPRVSGVENLPADTRFLVVANHFQRPGMWILHPAAAITQAICLHYEGLEPACRWVVTANWPRWRVGKWEIPSPGDVLLPRVAHALWCYAVPFAGTDPGRTARSLRKLLKDAPRVREPLGLFPEGVAGTAGRLGPPLAGTERLIAHLAKGGRAVVPVGIVETDTLEIRFGPLVEAGELMRAPDAAALAMERVGMLVR